MTSSILVQSVNVFLRQVTEGEVDIKSTLVQSATPLRGVFYGKISLHLTAVFMVAAFPSLSNAQFGPFIGNGLGVNTGITHGRNHSSISAKSGYVFRSLLETGVMLLKSDSRYTHFEKAGVGPYATLYPIWQSGTLPISAYVSGGYTFNWFLGDEADRLEDLGIELNSTTGMLEVGVFRSVNVSENIKFVPTASADYSYNTFEIVGPVASAEEEGAISITLSISLLYRVSATVRIALIPLISLTSDGSRYGVSAALVLPQ